MLALSMNHFSFGNSSEQTMCSSILWIITAIVVTVRCEKNVTVCHRTLRAASGEVDIRDYLLERYDKRVFLGDDTQIDYKMKLLSMEYQQLTFDVTFVQVYSWRDMRLAFIRQPWLRTDEALEIGYGDVWTPTIGLQAHRSVHQYTKRTVLNFKHFSNGTLHVVERVKMGLICQSNFQVFPFDWPRCMAKVAIDFTRDAGIDGRLTLNFQELTRSTGFRVEGAHLARLAHAPCVNERNSTCVCIQYTFYREVSFYVYNGFLPSDVAVTSSFMAFWIDRSHIPPMTSARCIIGMMTRLGFTAISSNLRAQLPVTNDLMALNVWEAICIIFIYISLMETCCVTYLVRTSTPEDKVDRKALAQRIEFLARTVLPSLFLCFNIVYFAIFIWVKHYEGHKRNNCDMSAV